MSRRTRPVLQRELCWLPLYPVIFPFLSCKDAAELRRTCRSFHQICGEHRWADLPRITHLQRWHACFPRAIALNVRGMAAFDDAALLAFAASCPALTRLNIGETAVTQVGLTHLLDACVYLTELHLDGLSVKTLRGVAHSLAVLSVNECVEMTDSGLAPVADTVLHTLDIGGCSALTDAAFEHFQRVHVLSTYGAVTVAYFAFVYKFKSVCVLL
jgi:hypothetical protein